MDVGVILETPHPSSIILKREGISNEMDEMGSLEEPTSQIHNTKRDNSSGRRTRCCERCALFAGGCSAGGGRRNHARGKTRERGQRGTALPLVSSSANCNTLHSFSKDLDYEVY